MKSELDDYLSKHTKDTSDSDRNRMFEIIEKALPDLRYARELCDPGVSDELYDHMRKKKSQGGEGLTATRTGRLLGMALGFSLDEYATDPGFKIDKKPVRRPIGPGRVQVGRPKEARCVVPNPYWNYYVTPTAKEDAHIYTPDELDAIFAVLRRMIPDNLDGCHIDAPFNIVSALGAKNCLSPRSCEIPKEVRDAANTVKTPSALFWLTLFLHMQDTGWRDEEPVWLQRRNLLLDDDKPYAKVVRQMQPVEVVIANPKTGTWACAYCGRAMEQGATQKKYHSAACRMAAHRERTGKSIGSRHRDRIRKGRGVETHETYMLAKWTGKKSKKVPRTTATLSDALVRAHKMLRPLMEPSPYVFLSLRHLRTITKNVRAGDVHGGWPLHEMPDIWNLIQKLAGIHRPGVPYDLRHTYSMRLCLAGYDVNTHADFMGHSVATSIEFYQRVKRKDFAEAEAKMKERQIQDPFEGVRETRETPKEETRAQGAGPTPAPR